MKSFINYVLTPILDHYKWSKVQVLDFLFSLIPSIIVLYFLRNEEIFLYDKEDNSFSTFPMKWSIVGFIISLALFLLYKAYTYSKEIKKSKSLINDSSSVLILILSIAMYITFFLGVFLGLPVLTVIFFFYFLLIVIKEILTKKSIRDSSYILYLLGMCLPMYFFFGNMILRLL